MKPFWVLCLRSGRGLKKGRLYICIGDNNGLSVIVKRKKKCEFETFHIYRDELRLPEEEYMDCSNRPVMVRVTVTTDDGRMIVPESPRFDEKTCLWGEGKCFEI